MTKFTGFFAIISIIIIAGLLHPVYANAAMIRGRVVDAESGMGIPSANIIVFEAGSEEQVSGGSSNDSGGFRLPIPFAGTYDIQFRVIGYEVFRMEAVEVAGGSEPTRLGEIEMIPSTMDLPDVSYTTEREEVQLEADRRIYRVSQDLAGAGSTASEVLENVPSVTVDIDGNVSLRGNTNVRILVDGKPSSRMGIDPADALQQIPAEQIDRIEVITNPSARYDADGSAGIINIVMKEDRDDGMNGSVAVFGGYPGRYGISAHLNYRVGKFNMFANESIRYRSNFGEGFSEQDYYNNPYYSALDTDRENDRSGIGNNFRGGFEFFPNRQTTFTLTGFHYYGEDETDSDVTYNYYDLNGDPMDIILRNDPEDALERWYGGTLDFRRTFGEQDHEWTAQIQVETGDETEESSIREYEYSAGENRGDPTLYEDVLNSTDEISYVFQTDYIHPFNEDSRFEIGWKSHIRDFNNDFTVEQLDDEGNPVIIDERSNDVNYTENIHAGYATYSNRFHDLHYQLGLRGEYSDIGTKLKGTGITNNRDYMDWFPSAHLSYELNPVNSILTSYSRRLNRPRYWFLLPYWNYSDSRNVMRGNPNLDPEYTDSYELGYLRHWDTGSLTTSAYYRHTTGVIEMFQSATDTSTLTSFYNLSTRDAVGLEFIGNYNPARWLRLQGNVNIYQAHTEGEKDGQTLDSESNSWFARTSAVISLSREARFQLRFFYRGPQETVQGERKAMSMTDVGFTRTFQNNTWDLTLSVRDLFNTRKREMEIFTDDFYTYSEFRRRSRSVTLRLTYRFNQDRQQRQQDRQTNGTEYDDGYHEEMD